MDWKLLGKKNLLNTYKTAIQSWKLRMPNGKVRDFFITEGYSFIMVFAVDTKGKVIILKQHYIAQQKKLLALVAGIIDDNEQVKTAAKRELLEETGYAAKKIVSLGKSVRGKYTTGTVYHFLALDAEKIQEPNLEEAEDIKISALSVSDFKKLLAEHKFMESYAEVCAYRALGYLDKLKK